MIFKLDNYFYLKNRSFLSHNSLQISAGARKPKKLNDFIIN